MTRLFNLHTHNSANDPEIVAMVNQYPREFNPEIPFYSIGIHPWYIEKDKIDEDLQIIESKIQQENCLAVGECGLDKRIEIPFDLQMEIFELQLALSEKYQKPVVIHCVAAFSEVILAKKRLKISVPMIIHGFSKNAETAKQLLDNGFYLSFGKYLLRNPDLGMVFKSVPDHRFFLETDTVEESIREVYDLAAKYKGIDLKNIREIIGGNCSSVFNLKI